ncbi:hypothetical protein [Aquisphaera insulae]|uniref:hypothetical protein n=1 Tax=Aquisphaera insulae TaxID=2712864 RepID=UPI0013EB602C|nr:hypothetical protein [Aquisphaera insulae]
MSEGDAIGLPLPEPIDAIPTEGPAPAAVEIGPFHQPTPVSDQADDRLEDGQIVELWGDFPVKAGR